MLTSSYETSVNGEESNNKNKREQIDFLTFCGFSIVLLCIIHESICRNFVPFYKNVDTWEMDKFWKFFSSVMNDKSIYLILSKLFLIIYSITIPIINYKRGSVDEINCIIDFVKTFFPTLFYLLYSIVIFQTLQIKPNLLFFLIYTSTLSVVGYFYLNYEVASFFIILLVTFIISTFTMMLNKIFFWIFIGSFTIIGLVLRLNVVWKNYSSSKNQLKYRPIYVNSIHTEYI